MTTDRKVGAGTDEQGGGESPQRRPRATIRDVAARANVSIGTVSRVVSGSTPVSEELSERVLAAAASLGYKPRARAPSVSAGALRLISFCVSDLANLLFAPVVTAAEERLAQLGYAMLFANTRNETRRENEFLAQIGDRSVLGAILSFGEESHPGLGKALRKAGVPAVILDRTPPRGFDSIVVDHRGGTLSACSYLIGLGHRRIAMITAASNLRPGVERIAGFRMAHEQAGAVMDERLIRTECVTADAAFAETKRLLAMDERPTAMLTLGSQALGGTLRAIAASGLSIPGDISLVCFGDTEMAKIAGPAITCVQWDRGQLGRQAVDLLVGRMAARGGGEARTIVLPTEIILRGSCAPPRR